MRHRVQHRKFSRTTSHRKAMLRNMAQSMIEHGQIKTTLQKAKDLRPVIERLVTLAKSANGGSETARQVIHRILSDRAMIPKDRQGEYEDLSMTRREQTLRSRSGRRYRTGQAKGKLAFTSESVTRRLLTEIAPKFEDRPGGYTRVIKVADRRIGDGGFQAVIQFVGNESAPGSVTKPRKTARRRRADARYAMAIKGAKQAAGRKDKATSAASVDAGQVEATDSADTKPASDE